MASSVGFPGNSWSSVQCGGFAKKVNCRIQKFSAGCSAVGISEFKYSDSGVSIKSHMKSRDREVEMVDCAVVTA